MKKWYEMIVKAIEVTKQYDSDEIKLLSWLFSYLNNFDSDLDDEWFWTWVSAKWLWKLLNPLTRTGKKQPFREWWQSVSNLARLKDDSDYERKEIITKIPLKKGSFEVGEKSQTSKIIMKETNWRWWKRDSYWTKEIDYILTLRAWEYCAVLTKWDSWDLYRRFIFDIKDEFLRLVFRYWKSIETRSDFTQSIWDLDFMQELKKSKKNKELWNVYWEMTNLIYLELFWVKANEFKELNDIDRKYFAKDFFTKDWLFDLEKLENKLSWIIMFNEPENREKLKELIKKFLIKQVKLKVI